RERVERRLIGDLRGGKPRRQKRAHWRHDLRVRLDLDAELSALRVQVANGARPPRRQLTLERCGKRVHPRANLVRRVGLGGKARLRDRRERREDVRDAAAFEERAVRDRNRTVVRQTGRKEHLLQRRRQLTAADERAEYRVVRQAVAAADRRFAVSRHVPRETGARREIVVLHL